MKTTKNKIVSLVISIFFILSMTGSMMLIPNAYAHNPAWSIPTYAYIAVAPNPIGVGQTMQIYMWLDEVYGAAGGTTAALGTNASTASAALTANFYRFHNYNLTVIDPNGQATTTIFAVVQDTTSNQESSFTPTVVGTYTLIFTFPGQVYGANGDGYEKSSLIGDTYLPSSAETTLTVTSAPIPAAINSYPLPSVYWTHPIYGENTYWYTISSNWLGSGYPVPADYTSSSYFHGDAIGPITGHVMWTKPLQFGGVVGGNPFIAGGSDPNGGGQGVMFFEGSSYEPRYVNPIIISGVIFYTEPVSFTGPSAGPTDAIDLRTGQLLWSKTTVPPLSFGYIYNVWNGDQHGTFPPMLFAQIGGGTTGLPVTWETFDAYTGDMMFNITNVPGFAAQTGQTVGGQPAVALTYGSGAGPSGELLRWVFMNTGTSANPQWYLAEWNSSKLWQYDVNPYTGGGSFNPSPVNASNGAVISNIPINAIVAGAGTMPNGVGFSVQPGSTIIVNANIPINSTTLGGEVLGNAAVVSGPGIETYDWNVSVPWLNTMPLQPTYNAVTGQIVPQVEQGTAMGIFAAGGVNPVAVLGANPGDMLLCRNGSLPTGFRATSAGFPQLPYTIFAVNLNASRGAIGSILWMQTYNPPAGNLTMAFSAIDWQARVFTFNYEETLNWVGYSLDTGQLLWTTPTQSALDYYGVGSTMIAALAYGTMYTSGFSGICYAFNDVTGKLLWTYGNGGPGNSTYGGLQIFYGDYPTFIQSIANGVIYLATNEHTIPNPIYKGTVYTAINATTGQQIWQLAGYPSEWSSPGSEWSNADGYLTMMNGLDNQIYSVGQGPSALTVNAGPKASTLGTSVVIQGTVMDISAGTKETQQAADFPNGVPVASDASMKDWMGYVYQQKPEPTNFTGVPVQIAVLDSNGNHYTIGNAMTDENGIFSLTWTPTITGNYTVFANFLGTNGYWPSSSETTFAVDPAPPTAAPAATPATNLASNTTVMYGIVAIAIIIVIIGAVLAILVTRKHA